MYKCAILKMGYLPNFQNINFGLVNLKCMFLSQCRSEVCCVFCVAYWLLKLHNVITFIVLLTGPILAVYCNYRTQSSALFFLNNSNFVHFCQNFKYFVLFCPFLALFLKNCTHALTFKNSPWLIYFCTYQESKK